MCETLREALPQLTSPWQYPRLIREGANDGFRPTYDPRRNATNRSAEGQGSIYEVVTPAVEEAGFAPLAIGRN